jgi:1-aminocyclopropane-1-carboxylate synthase
MSLSQRSLRAMKPLSSYFPIAAAALERPWTPSDPRGNIVMVIAENRLMSERFMARWRECGPPSRAALFYSDFRGTSGLRSAVASCMSRHVTRTHAIAPEQVALGNGCGSVLDTLFHVLCDEGDACLLPAPLYPTFCNDLESRANVEVQVVPTLQENGFFPTVNALERASASAAARGHPPKVLLLTNPTNPLGTVWPADSMRGAIEWATAQGLHVVSDEIYAASVFGEGCAPFESAWDIAAAHLSDDDARRRVHVVYGLAKDFGVSGFRAVSGRCLNRLPRPHGAQSSARPEQLGLESSDDPTRAASHSRQGAVATRHEGIIKAWENLGYMTTIPGVVQEGLAEMLNDEGWVDSFLHDNRAALRASFNTLAAALDEERVPRDGGGAAMFAWLDLRGALPESPTWEDERRFFERMHGPDPETQGGGVLLTPGGDCFASEPGFFRACWAATPPEAHAEAARRIAAAMAANLAEHRGSR